MWGLPELAIALAVVPAVLGAFAFWIWMLIECVTRESPEGNERLVWVIILVFTHVVGAALYLFVRRPLRIAEVGR